MKGLFIHKSNYENTPAVKTGEDSYELITGQFEVYDIVNKSKVTLSAWDYLLYQLNQRRELLQAQIKSIDDLEVPVIDFDVFGKYDLRELEIKTNTKLQKDFQKAGYKILSNTKLIKVKSELPNQADEVYIAKDDNYSRAENILEDKELKKAKDFTTYTLNQLKRRLSDNLNNEWESEYKEMVKAWDSI